MTASHASRATGAASIIAARLLAAGLLLAGMGWAAPARADCTPRIIRVAGIERSGIVCASEERRRPSPALLVFHGRGGSARDMLDGAAFHRAWPEAVVVYLDGLPGSPSPYDPAGRRAGWQLLPGEADDRDVAFADAVVAMLTGTAGVDPARIYAAGHSNGARFVGVLWAARGERFRALAFSAAQAGELIDQAPPRPVFMAMGVADRIVPFAMQQRSIGIAARRFGIAGVDDATPGARTMAGRDGSELALLIHPGGHAWPHDQTRRMVAFFRRHDAAAIAAPAPSADAGKAGAAPLSPQQR